MLRSYWHALVGHVGTLLKHCGLDYLNQYDWRGRRLPQAVDLRRGSPDDRGRAQAVVQHMTMVTKCAHDDMPPLRR